MDNIVGKYVYNFEDNCVENIQQIESQIPQWVRAWAEYMIKQSSSSSKLDEASIVFIQQILMANLQGDSCLRRVDYPELNPELLGDLMSDELAVNQQITPFVYDDQYFYLYRYWQLEQRLALQVKRLKQQNIEPVQLDQFEDLLEDPHQKNALGMVAQQSLNIITGGPGTGKTYTLARIIAVLNQAMPNIRIAMAAPTGKAAQRMKEALGHSFNDQKLIDLGLISDKLKHQDTLTIHRLLGLGHQGIPRFNLKQPLPYDVIVIDEASMLDLQLATMLFEAVADNTRLILLGDSHQLASVDVGSVLADFRQVQSLDENHVNLITSRRFKEGALIGEMAKFIQFKADQFDSQQALLSQFEHDIVKPTVLTPIQLESSMPDHVQMEYLLDQLSISDVSDYYQKLSWGFEAYFDALKKYIADDYAEQQIGRVIDHFDQYRILTAIRHGTFGLQSLNNAMEKALLTYLPHVLKKGDWYVGRPVMMSYNDYQLGLSNGDIGLCFKHRTDPSQFEVYFPSLDKWVAATRLPKSIQTAFALTIHKSQGSEFKHTAVVLDQAATQLLSQELIYTAITRAKSVVTLLVSPQALNQALSIKTKRSSGLAIKINHLSLTK